MATKLASPLMGMFTDAFLEPQRVYFGSNLDLPCIAMGLAVSPSIDGGPSRRENSVAGRNQSFSGFLNASL